MHQQPLHPQLEVVQKKLLDVAVRVLHGQTKLLHALFRRRAVKDDYKTILIYIKKNYFNTVQKCNFLAVKQNTVYIVLCIVVTVVRTYVFQDIVQGKNCYTHIHYIRTNPANLKLNYPYNWYKKKEK